MEGEGAGAAAGASPLLSPPALRVVCERSLSLAQVLACAASRVESVDASASAQHTLASVAILRLPAEAGQPGGVFAPEVVLVPTVQREARLRFRWDAQAESWAVVESGRA